MKILAIFRNVNIFVAPNAANVDRGNELSSDWLRFFLSAWISVSAYDSLGILLYVGKNYTVSLSLITFAFCDVNIMAYVVFYKSYYVPPRFPTWYP